MSDELTLNDLLGLDGPQLHRIIDAGLPVDADAVANTQYLGVDLSLPSVLSRLLWKTFRKTFYQDPEAGVLRGWNVRMEQRGVEAEQVPMTDPKGGAITFGHYHLRSASGLKFPRDWSGGSFLDYTVAGNLWMDVARLGYTPLVAVNRGCSDLLLGWEVFRLGPGFLPLPLYWALQLDGPLEEVVPVPRAGGLQAGLVTQQLR